MRRIAGDHVESTVDWMMASCLSAGPEDGKILRRFSGYVPLDMLDGDAFAGEQWFIQGVTPRDCDMPIDVTTATWAPAEWGPSVIQFTRTRAPMKGELRALGINASGGGKFDVVTQVAFFDTLSSRIIRPKGTRDRLVSRWRGKWEALASHDREVVDPDGQAQVASAACMTAFTFRYEWCVRFAYDSAPDFSLRVTPHAALVLFRDRDKPSEKSRRDSLLHWVRAHMRSRGESAAHVREHLRGAVPFHWRGFTCTIRPSKFDIDRSQREDLTAAP
jgi:hypothetical protein